MAQMKLNPAKLPVVGKYYFYCNSLGYITSFVVISFTESSVLVDLGKGVESRIGYKVFYKYQPQK